jgi:hypothetical protein
MRKPAFIISLILLAATVVLYIMGNRWWYYPLVVGGWLFFDHLSHLRGNKTTLDLLIDKNYSKFILLYVVFAIAALIMESLCMVYFKLWNYSYFDSLLLIYLMIPPFYPPTFMFFKEMYCFVRSVLRKNLIHNIIAVIAAMILGIIIVEIPNIYSKDWIYNIPIIEFEIFHMNIVVIIGWVILILGPYYIYRLLKIK